MEAGRPTTALPGLNPTYCGDIFNGVGCLKGIRCRKRHDIRQCSCGLVLLAKNYVSHIRGRRHRQLFLRLKERNRTEGSEPARDPLATRRCDRCPGRTFFVDSFDAHLQWHARRDRQTAYQATIASTELDKEGIVVSAQEGGADFGVLDAQARVEIAMTITNTTREYRFALESCRMRSSTRNDGHGVHFSARMRGNSKNIKPGVTRTLSLLFHPSYAGHYEDTVELVFWHHDLRRRFLITRRVKAIVGDREDHEQIRPSAPYTGPQRVSRLNLDEAKIIVASRPPTWTPTVWKERLPEYKVPQKIIDAAFSPEMAGKRNANVAKGNLKRLMPALLNAETYATWWQILIHVEEEQLRHDLELYAMKEVEILANYPRYVLKVPGLAEGRPSVLVGDYILASHHDPDVDLTQRTWYQGRVHDVRMADVVLSFGEGFSVLRGTKFDVRFVLNRLPFRRMHHALANKWNPNRILFPTQADVAGARRTTMEQRQALTLYNRQLGEDEEQLETVTAIYHQRPGSVPFAVFGPPGTGKTITIIEAMQQLLDKDENIRILACAPSNSAADLLAQKLSMRGKNFVLRLNSLSRKYSDLPENLREFSYVNENKVFAIPPIEKILQYRVVVATCLTAASLASLGTKRGHFNYIFVDEAGQGKEPEVISPIKTLADAKTNIILAGDHQQLGPIVHSPLAGSLGLRTSFLSRIMERDIYDLETGTFCGITTVKLVKNFRSHPSILEFSNEQFYNSQLRPCGDPAMTHSLEAIDELPKKRFPVIFHGIVGKDAREASSPSFFNVDEASQVKKYCKALIENRKYRLKAEHIGVITPYHAQRCKILDLLKEPKLRDIKVGSVEEFQGQERRVIIMSTVRSNTDYVTSDIVRSLGFVANSRRMNVALTRAQALLVVVGNPVVLSLDPLWRTFMNFVHARGGWRGKEIDWDPEAAVLSAEELGASRRAQAEGEMEETMARLRSLIVSRHEDSDFEIDLEDSDDEDEAGAFERPILREAE